VAAARRSSNAAARQASCISPAHSSIAVPRPGQNELNANHSIGVSPLLSYQRFKMDGLQAFAELGFPATRH